MRLKLAKPDLPRNAYKKYDNIPRKGGFGGNDNVQVSVYSSIALKSSQFLNRAHACTPMSPETGKLHTYANMQAQDCQKSSYCIRYLDGFKIVDTS